MRLLKAFFKGVNIRAALSWAFYDFANSSYSLLIVTFVFPIYFKEVIAGAERGDFYWGLVVSLSILAGGLLAPVVGAMADYDGRKKTKFILFATLSMLGTALLFFTGEGKLLFASLIFMISNIAFEVAQTLYDSFLARVSTKETVGRISGLAWGLGYIGGVVAMLALKPLYANGYAGELEFGYRLVFPLTAAFFFLFALPSFLFLKEEITPRATLPFAEVCRRGLRNAISTIRSIRQYKTIAWFLLGFYFINDALVTIFSFTPIYARTTFGMEFEEIFILLLIAQLIAFPAATFIGLISDLRGSRKILLSTIAAWMVIVLLLALATNKLTFYILALLTGLVVGSSQAVARSWLSKLVPDEKRFEFFGFNGFASKIAATTGPLLFGTVSLLTGNQRLAMASLIPFFLIAFIIFNRIKTEELTPLSQGTASA